ncbi:ABC transporter permease subunit [Paracoccus onubensis]|uniref:ABC transporter permease subunit n=1 Tax=Paracoccus onubensis TaxID=1675788 RepID=UPI001C71B187|nr:ABC transporter permease subunit [Paracoccus onubensis]
MPEAAGAKALRDYSGGLLTQGRLPLRRGLGVFDVRIIPSIIVLSMQPIALIFRQTRSAVLEILSEDFMRTARAKGVSEAIVALKHILRPALTPIVAQLGLILITIINRPCLSNWFSACQGWAG